MDRLEAILRLSEVVEATEDETAREALSVLATGGPPFPPYGYGALGGRAAELAQHVYKTGLAWEWRTPAPDSVGMERLAKRMTDLLDAFLDMWQEERERIGDMNIFDVVEEELGAVEEHKARLEGRFGTEEALAWQRAVQNPAVAHVDEAYQPEHCDVCGLELLPDGRCPASREFPDDQAKAWAEVRGLDVPEH